VAGVGLGAAQAAPPHVPVDGLARVVDLVNAERSAAGLAPLATSVQLASAAQSYADWMATANFFSHTGPDGSGIIARAEAAGYQRWAFLAENLAGGQPTPERVVAAWMKSPVHRANILAAEATEIGVGHAFHGESTYGHYWALEFGARW
jgi:uncharacterized protein YkwD